jgi:hypothetical protein
MSGTASNGAEVGNSNHVPTAIEPSANVAFDYTGNRKPKSQIKSTEATRRVYVSGVYLEEGGSRFPFTLYCVLLILSLFSVPHSLLSLFFIAHTLYPTFFGGLDIVTPYFSIHR